VGDEDAQYGIPHGERIAILPVKLWIESQLSLSHWPDLPHNSLERRSMNMLALKSMVAFAAGAVLMLALSFTVYRRSYYYKKAEAEMRGVEHRPGLLSRLVTLAILFVMILFFVLVDLWVSSAGLNSFAVLLGYNLLLVGALSIFDALFIDFFMLVIWRPAFLGLPEGQPTREAMTNHIKRQMTAGWIIKVPIALLASALACVLGAGASGSILVSS
jgi:hypothetical protein